MKNKIWLISIVLVAGLLLAFSGQYASAYFNDSEISTDNVLRIKFPPLLSANNFAVLAGSTITNTGNTIITGDLGLSPGTAVVGFPPGIVIGTQYITDAVAAQAQTDLTTAYNYFVAQTPDVDLTGQDLGGLSLTPGVYFYAAAAGLTGTLTLDASGNSSAVFIFQIGSTLTTAANSQVSLINSAKAANVYWVVDTATLGTDTVFTGNIMALTTITLNNGTTLLDGRALARNGAVTLDTNIITKPTP